MKPNLQNENQSNQSFDQTNSSIKSKDSADLTSRPSFNENLTSCDLTLPECELRQRSLSEVLLIKGRPSIVEKSFDTQSVKETNDSHPIFKAILHSKNFLLKSEVCQKSSVQKESNPKEASPLVQYFYPSLIPKPELKPILAQSQLSSSIICQNGRIKNMNYIHKENVVRANEGFIKFDQCDKIGQGRVSLGSNGNGNLNGNRCYYTHQTGMFFLPNDSPRYSQQYESEFYDNVNNPMNKFSSIDSLNGFPIQKPNKQSKPMPMNNISALMCENYSNETLGELSIYLIKEQNGCKLLQKRVKQHKDFANSHLFPNLLKDICELICDSFGNYLFQILFDYLSDENLSLVLSSIKASFDKICMSPYGTRVIQSLLEIIKTKPNLLDQLNALLTPQLLTSLANDQQGNYIIQKYIVEVPYPDNQFIYDAIKENFIEIAKTKQGCCTIQKCLKDSSKTQKEELMKMIYSNMFALITDQFGSYIFQYIIAKESSDVQIKVINLVLPRLVSICKRKYSSNAIEKCFENTNEAIQNLLLRQLIENEQWIDELIVDSFGNYVIQKALMVSKGEVYMKMLKTIAKNIKKLKQVPFGNKLISILITKHKEFGHFIANDHPNHFKDNSNGNSISTESTSSPAFHYQQRQNHNNHYQRNNGLNLNQNMNNKMTKALKSS